MLLFHNARSLHPAYTPIDYNPLPIVETGTVASRHLLRTWAAGRHPSPHSHSIDAGGFVDTS